MSQTCSILHRLKALGLSQNEITRRTGIPQPRLSRWAAGRPATGADDALKLLDLLSMVEGGSANSAEVKAAPLIGAKGAPPVGHESVDAGDAR